MSVILDLKDDRSERVSYDYADYPIYNRYAYLSSYPNFSVTSHWHDDIELIAVLSGEMCYNINGEIISLKSGEGVFVNSRQMHFGFSESGSECEFICLLLHPILLCTTPAYEYDFVLPLINNTALPFLKLCPDIPWQAEIYRNIQKIHSYKTEKTAPLRAQTAFGLIWSLIYENTAVSSAEVRQSGNLTIIKNMVGFIQKNYRDKITLSDIAASGAVGQSKCCKLFSEYFSQTPNAYLTNYRLNKASELLKDTDMSVTEIAEASGFSGAAYFAEAFKKWLCTTPSEYRNRIKKSDLH